LQFGGALLRKRRRKKKTKEREREGERGRKRKHKRKRERIGKLKKRQWENEGLKKSVGQ